MPSAVIMYSRISGSWRLARVLSTVSARLTRDRLRRNCNRITLSDMLDIPDSDSREKWKRSGTSIVMSTLMPRREHRWASEYMYSRMRI